MSLIENKKAYHDYEILNTIEAGLVLKGLEVKALKNGKGSIAGSRAIIRGNEAYVLGMDIPPYQPANTPADYDPQATRKLLLKKQEIVYLGSKAREKGLTLVPLAVYNKGGFLKVKLGICQGLKKYDKREKIKEKETKRKIDREMKKQM